jgi:penicillin-insensitive murein DD-endopeptidase
VSNPLTKGLLALGLSLLADAATANAWSEAEVPASGTARAIGEASAGCVRGARMLVPEGPGYMVMHLERNRYWGHPDLIAAIRELGREIAHGLGMMHVGDLGMSRGGPMPFGHRSHQTGLDVDVWFDLSPTLHIRANSDRSNVKAFSVLNPVTNGLDYALWSESHAQMLKLAASLPDVDRIFVNARIKDELCRSTRGDRSWLRKIRPWYYHEDHFHMRLACPPDSPTCVRQEPIPPGDGCDALDWWLSKPAEPTPDRKTPSAPTPSLPAECRAVLRD